MGTKTVRLDDDVYERIKSRKRQDETFSEAIDRLTNEWTLLDLAEGESPIDPGRHRELLEQSEQDGMAETAELLEQMDVDVE